MRITMAEIDAGDGYNDGAELRLLIQSNEIMDLPRVIENMLPAQREIFSRYRRQPSDYRPILGRMDGYRFNDEWTFPIIGKVA